MKTLKRKEKLQRKNMRKKKVCTNKKEPKWYASHTEKSQKPAKSGLEKGGDLDSK